MTKIDDPMKRGMLDLKSDHINIPDIDNNALSEILSLHTNF